ncbi:DUF3159 domain-containing protein [Mycobacterium sp.]|uniref:DUF3159 domain-containing protein n=1 Tax=Mycobacterium sp. TaxID=1785 RepID=UPI001271C1E1|nr:DUF3159 domain-containing protein [Mycobacterium sp.]KAA8958315.1 MAG: DUF3159 domain-containing protein [Mycobacterium sp.]
MVSEPTPAQRLIAQLGGVSGLVYSSLPVLFFVPISGLWGLSPAVGTALGVAALVLVWRLIRRHSTRPAVFGFFGVAICALIAYVLGESRGYFLLGIWMSLLWATVFALSVLIRRPVVGYLWSWAGAHDLGWRDVRRAVYAFDCATLVWMLVFVARFGVQGSLYHAGRTGWLGVARIAMGWPLTAAAAAVTYLAIKVVQHALRPTTVTEVAGAADAAPPPPR